MEQKFELTPEELDELNTIHRTSLDYLKRQEDALSFWRKIADKYGLEYTSIGPVEGANLKANEYPSEFMAEVKKDI